MEIVTFSPRDPSRYHKKDFCIFSNFEYQDEKWGPKNVLVIRAFFTRRGVHGPNLKMLNLKILS